MLIEFSVENYLSFKNPVTLSMIAAKPVKEYMDNVIKTERRELLKSAVIYGANASGKSNLIKAMKFMNWFVVNSSKDTQFDETIDVTPFKLHTATENQPSLFEVVFLIDNTKYRYGFEVTQKEIVAEWLFYADKNQEKELFLRDRDGILVKRKFEEGKGLENKTRDNALFLSVVAQFNGEISKKILSWFNNLHILSGIYNSPSFPETLRFMEQEKYQNAVIDFVKKADLGIENIKIHEFKVTHENLPAKMPEELIEIILETISESEDTVGINVLSLHKKYNTDNNIESIETFDFGEEESEGTKKFFNLAGPILNSLFEGSILIIDELDARLHPLLTSAILHLFNSKTNNPKNAQLVFVTHDTSLLTSGKFRRDQIWFTEKNRQGASDLYSLVEYTTENGKVRKDAAFEKNYIRGRYGAIPYFGDFQKLVENI